MFISISQILNIRTLSYIDCIVDIKDKDRPIENYNITTNKTIVYKSNKQIKTKSNTKAYYNPYNLSEISNASPNLLWNMLEGTSFQTERFVNLLIEGENYSSPVNAIFMIAVARWESGHGKSKLAIDKNNIYSIRASRGGWKNFSDKEECLNYTLDLFSNYYFNKDNKAYTGTNIYQVGIKYCEGNTWAKEVNTIAQEIMNIK